MVASIFEAKGLNCPKYARERLQLVTFITKPETIQTILEAMDLPTEIPPGGAGAAPTEGRVKLPQLGYNTRSQVIGRGSSFSVWTGVSSCPDVLGVLIKMSNAGLRWPRELRISIRSMGVAESQAPERARRYRELRGTVGKTQLTVPTHTSSDCGTDPGYPGPFFQVLP